MKDYITPQERLTFPKKESLTKNILWHVFSIIFTYLFLIQLTNALGGV